MSFKAFKDPESVLDYSIRWDQWLQTGETISTSTWSIVGNESPITLIEDSSSIADYEGTSPATSNAKTLIWLSGGTLGVRYEVTNHVVSSEGREEDATLHITMKSK